MITIPEQGLQCDHHRCGCIIDPCCFNCPLEQCIYELSNYERRKVTVHALLAEGWDEDEVAFIAKLSLEFVAKARRGFDDPLRTSPFR